MDLNLSIAHFSRLNPELAIKFEDKNDETGKLEGREVMFVPVDVDKTTKEENLKVRGQLFDQLKGTNNSEKFVADLRTRLGIGEDNQPITDTPLFARDVVDVVAFARSQVGNAKNILDDALWAVKDKVPNGVMDLLIDTVKKNPDDVDVQLFLTTYAKGKGKGDFSALQRVFALAAWKCDPADDSKLALSQSFMRGFAGEQRSFAELDELKQKAFSEGKQVAEEQKQADENLMQSGNDIIVDDPGDIKTSDDDKLFGDEEIDKEEIDESVNKETGSGKQQPIVEEVNDGQGRDEKLNQNPDDKVNIDEWVIPNFDKVEKKVINEDKNAPDSFSLLLKRHPKIDSKDYNPDFGEILDFFDDKFKEMFKQDVVQAKLIDDKELKDGDMACRLKQILVKAIIQSNRNAMEDSLTEIYPGDKTLPSFIDEVVNGQDEVFLGKMIMLFGNRLKDVGNGELKREDFAKVMTLTCSTLINSDYSELKTLEDSLKKLPTRESFQLNQSAPNAGDQSGMPVKFEKGGFVQQSSAATSTCYFLSVVNAMMATDGGVGKLNDVFGPKDNQNQWKFPNGIEVSQGELDSFDEDIRQMTNVKFSKFEQLVYCGMKKSGDRPNLQRISPIGLQDSAQFAADLFNLGYESRPINDKRQSTLGERHKIFANLVDVFQKGGCAVYRNGINSENSGGHYRGIQGCYWNNENDYGIIVVDSLNNGQREAVNMAQQTNQCQVILLRQNPQLNS